MHTYRWFKFFNMKSYLLLLVATVITINSNAQDWLRDIQRHDVNFFTVQKEFNDWEKRQTDSVAKTAEYEDITEQYYRWERFWRNRITEDGTLLPGNWTVSERKKYLAQHSISIRSNTSSWQPIQYSNTGNPDNVGRVDCIAISPTDSNTIWAGCPTGGLWKSTDGGLNWNTTTDTLASLGISDIICDPKNPNIMYLATGNRDDANGGGSTFSIGVLKSIDTGHTWLSTGLNWSLSNSASVIKRLVIDPTNDSILYAAVVTDVYSYVYKTTDAGTTWNTILAPPSYNPRVDMALQPSNPSTVYVTYLDQDSGCVYVYTSINNGNTFTAHKLIASGSAFNARMSVTPANNEYVYVLVANQQDFNSLYLSKDGGNTFTLQADTPNILGYGCGSPTPGGGQGFYDLSIATSPVNANEVMVGGIDMWQSEDAGVSWASKSCWTGPPFVHADQHYTLYSTYHPNTIYQGCDGGIFKSQDDGNTWAAISASMKTTQFYGGDISQQDVNKVIGGAQDNGTILINDGSSVQLVGGDGGTNTFFDYANDNIYFLTVDGSPKGYVNGIWENCGTGNFQINPLNSNSFYAYAAGLDKSYNYAATFSAVTPNLNPLSYYTYDIKIPQADSNIFFAISNLQLYKFSAIDDNPVLLTGNLPDIGIYTPWVTDFCVSDADTNKIWLVTSGTYDVLTNRVYYTSDGGSTWTDITGSLPDVPYNCLVLQNDSYNGVYLATDMGVFFKNDLLSDWVYWSNGLPNTIISQLKIDYTTGQLLAVTFGRSMWKTNLYSATGINLVSANTTSTKIYPDPNNGSFTLQLQNTELNTQLQIFNVLGENCYSAKLNSTTTTIKLNAHADGIYLYRILSQKGELISSGKFMIEQ